MSTWDGKERRQGDTRGFCEQHIKLTNDMTEIKTMVSNIEKSITQGVTFKTAIISTLVGIVLTLFIQITSFSYLYGKMVNQIDVNTGRLLKLESNLVTIIQGAKGIQGAQGEQGERGEWRQKK